MTRYVIANNETDAMISMSYWDEKRKALKALKRWQNINSKAFAKFCVWRVSLTAKRVAK